MDRDRWEQTLARAMGRLGSAELRDLMDKLGDPPRLENLPYGFWEQAQEDWRSNIQPNLEQIFLEAAQEVMGEFNVGVDWALVNTEASRWAQSYSFELVKGITDYTRDALQQKISGFFQAPTTLGQLRESIAELFGPVRAEMIAITEVTRAATMGEVAVTNLMESEYGIAMEAIFHTSHDDIVCPICRPWNGKVVDSDRYPPLHPRCRCVIGHRFSK